ncbi:type VI secretion system baseplate subunit TssK [Archangium primigenium]|uniref:type VI secretion system baseplate subunit TssK n=1 Tax=[Archangium] primigenium TaxID=2792470 RepID=UPI001958FFB1|nr:type VI secretion system baseplate subunit TssK [Archangium primigenium]MBM7118738.1 type VI secretion system baseplate subunit TssK [Archangium primigenium]
MEPHKLARVRWQVGQTLLPDHFRAQESALQGEAQRYARLSGLPLLGISALEFNPVLLAEGTLALSSLSAVLPGGHLVDVPGNATVAPFSLEETGRSQLTVYLHLLRETRGAEGLPLYAEDPPDLERALNVLELSAEPTVDGMVSSLMLAGLARDEHGRWKLARELLPPLLQVGPHPFLAPLFVQLDGLLEQAHGQMRTSIRDGYVRGDRLSNARRALCAVRQLQALRVDMRHGIYPSTYRLFEALRGLYFETCCYLEAEPEEELPPYLHEEPGPGLLRWMELLERSFRPQTSQRSYRPFEFRDGRFVLTPLPQDKPAPNDFYLLVRRHERDKPRGMEGIRLASPLRLSVVRRQALKGISYRHVAYPSFPHSFDADIDWYQLTCEGEEWHAALREDGLSFSDTPAFAGAQVFLFWRRV